MSLSKKAIRKIVREELAPTDEALTVAIGAADHERLLTAKQVQRMRFAAEQTGLQTSAEPSSEPRVAPTEPTERHAHAGLSRDVALDEPIGAVGEAAATSPCIGAEPEGSVQTNCERTG